MIRQVFDKRQAIYVYELPDLMQMLEEDKLEMRDVSKEQVRQIRAYIVDNLLDNNVFLPPLVATTSEELTEEAPTSLKIIDGSHRLKALLSLPKYGERFIFQEDAEKTKLGFALKYAVPKITVAIQVIDRLSEVEGNQLFLDLNTRGKKVALSKRIAYDSRDDINLTTNRLLQSNKQLQIAGVEVEKAAVKRPNNKKFLSLAQLRNIVGIFLTGKDVESKISVKMNGNVNFQDGYELTNTWLEELFKLYPAKKIGDYELTMLASYPLILALVHYVLHDSEKCTVEEKKRLIVERMQRLEGIDWRRKQDVWLQFDGKYQGKEKYYYLQKDKATIQSLVRWLQLKGGGNDVSKPTKKP